MQTENAGMTLIKSISGIRGTIGGKTGSNLTPIDIVECTAGFGTWLTAGGRNKKVVVGRDGRISGEMVRDLSVNTLLAMGIDVIDLGLSTTPTVEMMVKKLNAGAGIIFTASHNPKEWNALKFLNEHGEFISAADGAQILKYIEDKSVEFSDIDSLGTLTNYNDHIRDHIEDILALPYINPALISESKLKVVVDCINSTGAIAVPPLLEKLGVEYILINDQSFGHFAHNPEPLAEHLIDLSDAVRKFEAHLGISVDPDVDRLAFVCEDGSMFGEEYTLVAVADFMLAKNPGQNTVSNLSSTRALSDITTKHGGKYYASAVGEVNVVEMMKKQHALIGGEGNGGVIIPQLHYGRDALAGIALFLTHVAEQNIPLTELKKSYPAYQMIKDKIQLTHEVDVQQIILRLKDAFKSEILNETDGLKIDFEEGWVHLRSSNTEPIIRIYAEAADEHTAKSLIQSVKSKI